MKKIIFMLTLATTLFANNSVNKEATISVQGTGIVMAKPDMLKIVSVVESEDSTVEKASEKNKNIVLNLIKKLERGGVAKRDITIGNYSVNLRRYNNEKVKDNKYFASTQIIIETNRLNRAENILDLLTKNGVTNICDIEFYSKDIEKSEEDAYRLAYKDAKSKAENIATLEKKTLAPKEIQLFNNYNRPIQLLRASDSSNKSSGIPLTVPKEIEVKANVNVVFYLN